MKARAKSVLFILLATLITHTHSDSTADTLLAAQHGQDQEAEISQALAQEQQFEAETGRGPLVEANASDPHGENVLGDSFENIDEMGAETGFVGGVESEREKEEGEENPEEDEGYIMTLAHQDEMTRLKNYKQISKDLQEIEAEFRACLEKVPSLVWSEKEIERCVGKDFTQMAHDVNFERAKIKDRAMKAIKDVLMVECYEKAGPDELMADACDIIETDVRNILWDGLDIFQMLSFNRDKYLFIFGRLPVEMFENIMLKIKPVCDELESYLDQVESYKELIIVRVKEYADDRTKAIQNLRDYNQRNGVASVKAYDLHIVETTTDHGISVEHLPANVRQDLNTHHVFGRSPYKAYDNKVQQTRAENLDKIMDEGQFIKFDQGEAQDSQEFVVGEISGGEGAKKKRRRIRQLRQDSGGWARKAKIRKMELERIKRRLERRHRVGRLI